MVDRYIGNHKPRTHDDMRFALDSFSYFITRSPALMKKYFTSYKRVFAHRIVNTAIKLLLYPCTYLIKISK